MVLHNDRIISVNYSIISYFMNFLKGVFGLQKDLNSELKAAQFEGSLYRVINNQRKTLFRKCRIGFFKEKNEMGKDAYMFSFMNLLIPDTTEKQEEYNFPIHSQMAPVTFQMTKEGKTYTCFEWLLDPNDQQQEYIGCYVDPSLKLKFKDILCKVIKQLLNDQNIKDHLDLCQEIPTFPSYGSMQKKGNNVSSKVAIELNDLLMSQSGKKQNKFVSFGSCYQIVQKDRKLINSKVVMIIKCKEEFQYEIQLLNEMGYSFKKIKITSGLHYSISTDEGYLKWLHIEQAGSKIIQVNFGKADIALTAQFAILQCIYEINNKRKVTDAIAQDQYQYIKRTTEKPNFTEKQNQQIVQTYQSVQQLQICEKNFIYENKEVHQGLQKYRALCQAKINDFEVASLGSMLEVLKISQDNNVERKHKLKLYGKDKQELDIDEVLMHDNDSKSLLHGQNGILYYYDLNKATLVSQYAPSKVGIQHVCPEFKLAETSNFKTFKAVSPNTIYQIDSRLENGVGQFKSYTTSPNFCQISVDAKGNFAVGSQNGELRLFDSIGKNANCKYPGLGDMVTHLESSKDGKWLLATYKNYLILLPTESENISLYSKKVNLADRPRPIRLQIKMQHLQLCKVKMSQLTMIPAKFDERNDSKERFIISGFGDYVVIWNLGHILKGNFRDYKFSKVDGEMIQADFKFNNVSKLIMTTSNGIRIKENKIQNQS